MLWTKVLAIDQSSTTSGYAFLEDKELVKYGTFYSRPNYAIKFSNKVKRLIDYFKPDIVVWEDLKGNRNVRTVRMLAEVTGILRLICEEKNMEYREYIPISVKAKVVKKKGSGDRGRKTKMDLAEEICALYGITLPSGVFGKTKTGLIKIREQHEFFNITDAIALGLYYFLMEEKTLVSLS